MKTLTRSLTVRALRAAARNVLPKMVLAAGAITATAPLALAPSTPVHATVGIRTLENATASDPDVIACPIPSGSDFIDGWGAPRSGGRRHEGVDMVADRGAPIVAVQTGDAVFKNNRLGGNAVWLTTEQGNKFYYAHLDSFLGDSRFVVEGEVIGYVGSTGNAQGPHLHFETHFDGDVGNPFSAASTACAPPTVSISVPRTPR